MDEIDSKRLWLDDVRRPPSDDWVWAKTVAEAVEILRTGAVVEASLDHDLYPFENDGIEAIQWMIDHTVFPRLVRVHSDNRHGSTQMCGLLERCGYRGIPGRPRHFVKKNGTRMSPKDFMLLHMKNAPRSMEKLR